MLDLSSGRLEEAIGHAGRAVECVDARVAELREALSQKGKSAEGGEAGLANGQAEVDGEANGQAEQADASVVAEGQEKKSGKGKGKQKSNSTILPEDDLHNLSAAQLAVEIRELEGLREDLGLKVRGFCFGFFAFCFLFRLFVSTFCFDFLLFVSTFCFLFGFEGEFEGALLCSSCEGFATVFYKVSRRAPVRFSRRAPVRFSRRASIRFSRRAPINLSLPRK